MSEGLKSSSLISKYPSAFSISSSFQYRCREVWAEIRCWLDDAKYYVSGKEVLFGRGMSVFVVETYVVKAEKRTEFDLALDDFLEFKEKHRDLFARLKSWKLFKQDFGAVGGMYIEMREYENIVEMDRMSKRIFGTDGMKKIQKGFHLLVEPATFSTCLWESVA
jgi:hypothetical protein